MRAGDAARRSVVTIGADGTVTEAAMVMDEAGVGALVVTAGGVMVGIVTDRDLVRRGLARRLGAHAPVRAVMSSPVVTIDADAEVRSVYALFREHAVRRVVVVDGTGPVGVLAVDDLVIDLAASLSDLVHPLMSEILTPHHDTGAMAGRTGPGAARRDEPAPGLVRWPSRLRPPPG